MRTGRGSSRRIHRPSRIGLSTSLRALPPMSMRRYKRLIAHSSMAPGPIPSARTRQSRTGDRRCGHRQCRDACPHRVSIDCGKVLSETTAFMNVCADYLRFFGELADKITGYTSAPPPAGIHAYTIRAPLGVVAAIVPWNNPLWLLSLKLGPALAAGNSRRDQAIGDLRRSGDRISEMRRRGRRHPQGSRQSRDQLRRALRAGEEKCSYYRRCPRDWCRFCQSFREEGATVAIGDIDTIRAAATAAGIGQGAYTIRLDVTDQASIDAAVAEVTAKAGSLDVLVNNAAVFDLRAVRRDHPRELRPTVSYQRRWNPVHDAGRCPPDDRAGPRRKDRQHGKPSRPPRRGVVAVYCATKAAVISLTQSAGLNLIRAQDQCERHRARRGRGRTLGTRRRTRRQVRSRAAR